MSLFIITPYRSFYTIDQGFYNIDIDEDSVVVAPKIEDAFLHFIETYFDYYSEAQRYAYREIDSLYLTFYNVCESSDMRKEWDCLSQEEKMLWSKAWYDYSEKNEGDVDAKPFKISQIPASKITNIRP